MTKRARERGRDRKSRYNCGNSIELDLFFEFKGASNRAIKNDCFLAKESHKNKHA